MAGLNGVPTSGGLRGSGTNAGASLSTSTTSIEGGAVDAGKTVILKCIFQMCFWLRLLVSLGPLGASSESDVSSFHMYFSIKNYVMYFIPFFATSSSMHESELH